MMQNTQWKWCYRSLFLAALSSVVCIYAFPYIDGFSGGYAIVFVSFFLAASAIAVAALFFHRARVMDFILNSTQPLAHWTYSPDVAMAVTVFLFIISRVAPRIALRYALSSPREAYIAENGMRMNGVTFEGRSEKKPAVLIFSFIQSVGLSIRSPFDIEIPVSQGEEEKARKIVQTYFL